MSTLGSPCSLAAEGAHVTICGRSEERLAAAVGQIRTVAAEGVTVASIATDVTDEAQVAAAVAKACEPTGGLDIVVASAGGSETIGPVHSIDVEAWRRTIDLNLTGTFLTLKHAAPVMVRGGGGSFIGVTSLAGATTHRWFGAYGVAKLAMDHLMQLAADELGPSRVRFNSIRPGLTRTEMVAAIFAMPELSEDYRVNTPLPRVGEVVDIANLAVFLLSDQAGWITGQAINVDGGQMLRRGPDFSPLVSLMFSEDALRGVVE